jgi:hypothetical protein
MSPDNYPLDYSGYGDIRPGSAQAERAQRMNRFRSDRASTATQHIDPYITAAAGTVMRSYIDAGASADAARRQVFETAQGQMALDAMMGRRRAGMLGQGDPVNYAHNISSGVAAGGFQTTFGGTMGGRQVHGRGHVSGQGALSERVSLSFQQGLLKNLYGDGIPGPSKMYGFDMEETSAVFNKLASRGGIGQIAHIERNASLSDRLSAAREGAVDQSVKAGLAGIDISGMSEEEGIEKLKEIASITTNDKLAKELTNVTTATDAVFIEDAELQKVSKVVESTVKGMASLSELYGMLSDEELREKLEEVSGMRIVNESQGRQAQAMVRQMKGAAAISGMDPLVYAEYSAQMQASLQRDVMEAYGFDARTSTQLIATTAAINRPMWDDSMLGSKLAAQTSRRADELGVNFAEGLTIDEIYEDKKQGQMEFTKEFKAVAMAAGGLNMFSGEQRKRVDSLLAEFDATSGIEDGQEQERARQLIKNQLEGEIGNVFGGDFYMAEHSRLGQVALANSATDPEISARLGGYVSGGRKNAENIEPAVKALQAMGLDREEAEAQAAQIRDNIDPTGMLEMLDLSRSDGTEANPLTDADRIKQQRDILALGGVEGDDANEFMSRFFDDEGRLKDETGFVQTAELINNASRGDGDSVFNMKKIGEELLNMVGADSNVARMRGEDQTVSLNSIMTSLLTGGVAGINDAESMALTLQAMADEGIALPKFGAVDKDGNPIMKSVEESYVTSMNFSQGLAGPDGDNLDKLEKLYGKPLDLHTKMGFASREAMIEASKKDSGVTAKALEVLKTHDDYAGVTLQGDKFNMSAMTDEARKSTLAAELDDYVKKHAANRLINNKLGMPDELSTEALNADGSFNASRFEADKFESVEGKFNPFKDNIVKMGVGLGRNLDLAELVNAATAEAMDALGAADEDGALTKNLQAQYDQMLASQEAGAESADFKTGVDGEAGSKPVEEIMATLKAAIEKLTEANAADKGLQTVGEMTVQLLRLPDGTNISQP